MPSSLRSTSTRGSSANGRAGGVRRNCMWSLKKHYLIRTFLQRRELCKRNLTIQHATNYEHEKHLHVNKMHNMYELERIPRRSNFKDGAIETLWLQKVASVTMLAIQLGRSSTNNLMTVKTHILTSDMSMCCSIEYSTGTQIEIVELWTNEYEFD